MATVKMVALAQFIASKVGKTGLTVTCDVDEYNIDAATVDNSFLTAQSMTEVRRGIYRLFFDGDDTRLYTATAITADSSVDQQHIAAVIVRLDRVNNADVTTSSRLASASYTAPLDASGTQTAAEAALTAYDAATGADVAAVTAPTAAAVADAVWDEALAGHADVGSAGAALTAAGGATDFLSVEVPGSYASGTAGYILGAINPAGVTVVSPVASDGTQISIVRGDDYANADGRAVTFTGSTWPTLTDGSVALIVDIDGTATSYAGTITGAQACRIEFTDVQTAALDPGTYDYDLQATLSGGNVITLVQGIMLVTADVR